MNKKVFPHGNVVNFGESVREMNAKELLVKLNRIMKEKGSMLMGTISLDQQELHIYGQVESAVFDEQTKKIVFHFTSAGGEKWEEARFLDDLYLSHEIHFDIQDRAYGLIRYEVWYITFHKDDGETTFFFADEDKVSQPLDCVVEFWKQGWEVGRDVDMNRLRVCTSTDFKGLARKRAR